MVDPCSNHPISWPFVKFRVAGNDIRTAMLEVEQHVRKCSLMLATRMAATGTSVTTCSLAASLVRKHGALILAEQLLDAFERDRIDVPGVARNVGHLLDAAVMRRMKTMVHAGR